MRFFRHPIPLVRARMCMRACIQPLYNYNRWTMAARYDGRRERAVRKNAYPPEDRCS